MKLTISAVFVIEAVLLTTALPISYRAQDLQQPFSLSRRPTPASSWNSFASTNSDSSSSSSSSSHSSKPKSKLASLLTSSTSSLKKTLTAPLSPTTTTTSSSGPFRCHSYPPPTPPLKALATHITDTLARYTDLFFENKSDPDRITFHTCLAGHTAADLRPSVLFGAMGKNQLVKVERLLGRLVVGKVPGTRVVVAEGGLVAVVVGAEGGSIPGGDGLR